MSDYSNLKEKTIFDFCDDENIIKEINDFLTKDEYIKKANELPLSARAFDLCQLAELTDDAGLRIAVDEQLGEYIEAYFNE